MYRTFINDKLMLKSESSSTDLSFSIYLISTALCIMSALIIWKTELWRLWSRSFAVYEDKGGFGSLIKANLVESKVLWIYN